MSWIKIIDHDEAVGELADVYRKVSAAGGQVDNILKSHSLRPHTLAGHMAIYKATLHHCNNTLPAYLLELIGVDVSALNRCAYCVEHHKAGLRQLLSDDQRFEKICAALERQTRKDVFDARERAALIYAERLTLDPDSVSESDIAALRDAGFDDGEILEINQVTAYFAYANRTILGLGTSHVGEELGHAPRSGDPDNWGHQ